MDAARAGAAPVTQTDGVAPLIKDQILFNWSTKDHKPNAVVFEGKEVTLRSVGGVR